MATVINSSFKPFSFDEMIKPLLLYKAEYDKVEQDYLKYLSDTDKLRLMATEDPNSRTANQYSTYNNELIAASEEFNKGMTLKNRQTLNNLKRRYSSEIVPISQAIELRQKQIEEQDKMYLADSDRMFSRLARNTSLDAYLDNPNLNYQSVSGKEITAKSAEDFKHLTKTILSQNSAKWQPILGNQYYERALQKGLTFEQAALIAKNDPNAAQEFNKIIDDAVELSHIANWDMSDEDKAIMLERARTYARQGAYAGIGDLSYQQQSNKAYDYAMQEQMAINKERRALEHQKQQQNQANRLAINPSNFYNNRELSEGEKKYNKAMNEYAHYFYKDKHGKWQMTKEGWNEYNRDTKESRRNGPLGVSGRTISAQARGENPNHTEFRKFMDSLGMKGMSDKAYGPWQSETAGNLWGSYSVESPTSKTARYDATRSTEYVYALPTSKEFQDNFKRKIAVANRSNNNSDLQELEYDSKGNKLTPVGGTLSLKDLLSDNYTIVDSRMSHLGNTIMVTDKEGNTRRFLLPAGINSRNEQSIAITMNAAKEYQELLNNRNLNPATRAKLEEEYAQILQSAYLHQSQLFINNKTEAQQFSPFAY